MFIGLGAGNYNTIGEKNVFVGCNAGLRNTIGGQNIFIGDSAGACNTQGTQNIFLGREAGLRNTTGCNNFFAGWLAGVCNVTGQCNVFIGICAGRCNGGTSAAGWCNVFLGARAGQANVSGNDNISIGSDSGFAIRSSCNSIFLGRQAGLNVTTGSTNIFMGCIAGCTVTTGFSNTIIGSIAGTAGLCNTVIIAAGTCERLKVDDSGLLVNGAAVSGGATITDDTTTNATRYITWEDVTSGTASSIGVSSTKLTWNPSTGTLTSVILNATSDERLKKNITKINNATDLINLLEGVEFEWLDNGIKSAGLIAQWVEKVLPHLVTTEDQGRKTLNYSGLIAYLVESVKELSDRVEKLENGRQQ